MSDYVELEMANGRTTIVSPEHADLGEKSLHVISNSLGNHYVAFNERRSDGSIVKKLLHREILGRVLGRSLKRHEYVDHINHDPFDNRIENIRLATNQQNQANRRLGSNNKSGYKGVSWHRQRSKWRSQIVVNTRYTHLGYFDTPEEAYEAYVKAAKEHFGEYAYVPGAEELEVMEGGTDYDVAV